jgi:hypothetical protein
MVIFSYKGGDIMSSVNNADFQYFLENYMKLYEKYGHKYIVIKNKKVLGTYDDMIVALETTMKTEELGTFIVQECNGDSSAYTSSIISLCNA